MVDIPSDLTLGITMKIRTGDGFRRGTSNRGGVAVNSVAAAVAAVLAGSGGAAHAQDASDVAGLEEVEIGETISAIDDPRPLPLIHVDEPTISMVFAINSSPMSGRDRRSSTRWTASTTTGTMNQATVGGRSRSSSTTTRLRIAT